MLKEILTISLQDVTFDEKALESLETELASAGVGASGDGSCEGFCSTAKK